MGTRQCNQLSIKAKEMSRGCLQTLRADEEGIKKRINEREALSGIRLCVHSLGDLGAPGVGGGRWLEEVSFTLRLSIRDRRALSLCLQCSVI